MKIERDEKWTYGVIRKECEINNQVADANVKVESGKNVQTSRNVPALEAGQLLTRGL